MADPGFSRAPTLKVRVLSYNFHQNFIKMKEIGMGGLTGDPFGLPLQRKTFVLFSIARWLYFPFLLLDVAAARDAGEAADGAGQVTGRGGGPHPRWHRRSGAERPRRGARQVRLHLHGTKQNAKANFSLIFVATEYELRLEFYKDPSRVDMSWLIRKRCRFWIGLV